jgi:hypothetical protein
MAIKITENNQGLFKLINTLTGEILHDEEFIDENVVKRLFINRELWIFIKKVILIYLDFPTGYYINDKVVDGEKIGDKFINSVLTKENADDILFSKFKEIKEDLNLDFDIVSLIDEIDDSIDNIEDLIET